MPMARAASFLRESYGSAIRPSESRRGPRRSALPLAAALLGALALAGCDTGGRGVPITGSGAAPPPVYAPITGISYPTIPSFRVGTPLVPITPTTTGGFAVSYEIDPFLPQGLLFDWPTGRILGTPAQASPPIDYTVTAENPSSSASVVITIEVLPPGTVVSFALAGSSVREGGLAAIDFALSPPPAAPLAIDFAFSGDALPVADFTAGSATVTVPAGATGGTIDLFAVDDADVEPAETVQISILPSPLVIPSAPATHLLTILDGDGPPQLSFASVSAIFAEGGGTQGVELRLFPPATAAVTATIAASGSSTAGLDWSAIPAIASFVPGETVRTVAVPVIDDSDFEGDETLVLTVIASTGAGIGVPEWIEIVIADDDPPPQVGFPQPSATQFENAGTVPVTLTLSAIAGIDVAVGFVLLGSAIPGVDYTIPSTSVTIPAGSLAATIPVALVADALPEPTEHIGIRIVSAVGADIGAIHTIWLAVLDGPMGSCTLDYAPQLVVATAGTPLVPIPPLTSCGSGSTFTALPPLPAGIALDPATGIISGIPLQAGPETVHVITASGSAGSAADQIHFRIDPSFAFSLAGATVLFDPADGEASFSLTVTLEEIAAPAATPQPVQGGSFGIRISPSELVIDSFALGATLAALNGGVGPDFHASNILPEGATLGFVVSFLGAVTLGTVTPAEIAEIHFFTVPAFLIGNATGASIAIPFESTVGSPPVQNVVVVGGTSFAPILTPGAVDFVP